MGILPPNTRSVASIAEEEGISDATLYNWRQQARNEGRLIPDSDNPREGWTLDRHRDKPTCLLTQEADIPK